MADKINHLAKLTDFAAPFYDLMLRLFWLGSERNFTQRLVDLMDLTDDESVLDVGCGTGTLSLMIANKMDGRRSVSGIDLSPRMIEVAKRKASRNGRSVEYRVASSSALPFDNDTFDVVVTSLVYHQLMSLPEKARTLSEIRRVLKPEGRYIAAEFADFTAGNLLIIHDSLIHKVPLFGRELLEENGLHIVKKVEIGRGILIVLARKLAATTTRRKLPAESIEE